MAQKACKGCDKTVDTSAKACPHCGRPNPTGATSPAAILGAVFFSIVGLSVCSRIVSPGSSSRDGNSSGSVPAQLAAASITVSAVDLNAAYEANEVAADSVYKGKRLLVTGKVQSIDKDFLDNIVVRLAVGRFEHAMATLTKSEAGKAGQMSKGDQLSLTCTGRGRIVGSPSLGDCVVTSF